jgi:hypothetical protein
MCGLSTPAAQDVKQPDLSGIRVSVNQKKEISN